jgi:uncharacterized membrane protein YjjP (DUF1212 family)
MENQEYLISPQYIATIALDIGAEILKCGGEIGRVEDTIERICMAYGASRVDVFAITSLIILTVTMPDGRFVTNNKRVKEQGTDLYRLEKFNALSRNICQNTPPADDIESLMKDITQSHEVSIWIPIIGGILASGSFAVFFGGTLIDGIGAAIVSLVVWLANSFKRTGANLVAYTVIISILAGFSSIALVYAGVGTHVDKLMIGSIMLLIPGVGITNSMRDMLSGDIIAGMLRLAEVILVACAIAIGFAISMIILGGIIK